MQAVVVGFYVEAIPNSVPEDAPARRRKPQPVSRVFTVESAAREFADRFVKLARYPHTVRVVEAYGLEGAV